MKIQKTLFNSFEVLFMILISMLLCVIMTGTQRNIEWYNILFVTCVLFAVMLIFYKLLLKLEAFLAKHARTMLTVFVIIWGIALYTFCYIFKNEPAHDYITVYDSAYALANGNTDIDWGYFALFRNNFLTMIIVSALMKIAFMLKLSEPIVVMLLFSVSLVLWSGICIFRLLRRDGHLYASCFMGLFLFAGFLPLWGGTFNLYTDCVSLSLGIWACYVMSKGAISNHKVLCFMAAGALWGIGYAIKPTVIISLVAILIILLLTRHWKKTLQILLFVLIGFVVSQIGVEIIWNQFPCAELESELAAPIDFWLALGLCEDGSYAENAEFAIRCLDTPGLEAKKQIAREHISQNIQELWNLNHLVRKARHNFASGHMGLPDFNRYPVNFMYNIFNDYGEYGGYAIMYSSGYFYAILAFGLLGSFLQLRDRKKGKRVSDLAVLGRLVVYGLIIFLMLFEANNRQLYNHMPWFALMGAMGCARVGDIKWRKEK